MKKTAAFLATISILLALCACGGTSGSTFLGRITAADGETLTVMPEIMSREHKTADTFSVSITGAKITDADGNAVDRSMLSAGQEAFITYDGNIRESYPAQITASAVKLSGAVLENPAAASKDKTITFNIEGEAETVAADKVALGDFALLVPSQGWTAQSAENTAVGPVVINPKDHSDISLNFRVYPKTDAAGAEKQLEAQYAGLVWSTWQQAAGAKAAYQASLDTNSESLAAFIAEYSGNTAVIVCSYPTDSAEGFGARLTQIAATLEMG
jgi:hypothetical protein